MKVLYGDEVFARQALGSPDLTRLMVQTYEGDNVLVYLTDKQRKRLRKMLKKKS